MHLSRTIERFRSNPELFYQRSPEERQFFLDQLMNWMNRLFSPNQPPISYRLTALSLSMFHQRQLEIRILRFVRNFVFRPSEELELPSTEDWFVYAQLRTFTWVFIGNNLFRMSSHRFFLEIIADLNDILSDFDRDLRIYSAHRSQTNFQAIIRSFDRLTDVVLRLNRWNLSVLDEII